MRYYKIISDDSAIQSTVDNAPKYLLLKDDYKNYPDTEIDSISMFSDCKNKDLMETGTLIGLGFLVSNRLKELFEEFSLSSVQFVPIVRQPRLEGHYFMFFNGELTNQIDYEKSNVVVKEVDLMNDIIVQENLPKSRDGLIKLYEEEYCISGLYFM